MPQLITRYLSGDCQAVRDLLLASISADSPPEQVTEAIEVADEFVRRSIDNLSRLHDALLAVEYQFADAENAFVLHESPDDSLVADFERRMGKVPLLASRWYRQVRSLDFSQTYDQLTDRSSPLAGLGWNVPFIVQSLAQAEKHWIEHVEEQEEDDRYRKEAGMPPLGPPTPELLIGGCASNNECKSFALPSFQFDDVLYNDGGGDQYFGDQIADGFRNGGFPVLSATDRTLKTVRTLYGEPNREYLLTRLPDNFEVV
jgi:hypothetical protein